MKLIIRHDDFDFRLAPQDYIDNHEKFIKVGLTETAVVQYSKNGRLCNFNPELVKYMNEAPNWDIQLHGWGHDFYSEWEMDFIVRDISAAIHWSEKLFNKKPTIWFPPWNQMSINMENVAKLLDLKIDNEANDISKFIRNMKSGGFDGHSVYYHLWSRPEAEQIDEMIEYAKQYENNRP